jgi:hypothetical protein
MEKKCRKCGVTKHLMMFPKHKFAADGRENTCKECKQTYQREYRRTREEEIQILEAAKFRYVKAYNEWRTQLGRVLMDEIEDAGPEPFLTDFIQTELDIRNASPSDPSDLTDGRSGPEVD